MKLLLIEEHPEWRHLLRQVLQRTAAELHECGVAAAVRMAAVLEPDGIVLDATHGGAEGWQVVQALHRVCPHAQLILLADETTPLWQGRARQAGATLLLSKEQLVALPSLVTTLASAADEGRPAPHSRKEKR